MNDSEFLAHATKEVEKKARESRYEPFTDPLESVDITGPRINMFLPSDVYFNTMGGDAILGIYTYNEKYDLKEMVHMIESKVMEHWDSCATTITTKVII